MVDKPKISYDEVAARIAGFRAGLRKKVDQWGGISKLAEATGMPQPSPSRPMDLGEEDIATDWIA